ncbi:MAG: hypothetical protein ACR2QQ_15490 [Gammaproteobacteria bacterium]
MSEIQKEKEKGQSAIAPGDDTAELDTSDILEFLMDELRESALPEEYDPSAVDEQEHETAELHEYVLPASALLEKRTLEELADMATGAYKYVPPEEDASDSPEDYFHHTRKLKALRMD